MNSSCRNRQVAVGSFEEQKVLSVGCLHFTINLLGNIKRRKDLGGTRPQAQVSYFYAEMLGNFT